MNVTVEVADDVTKMLDENPTMLDHLQLHGELDVNFDPDKQTYTLSGTWYQCEWALHYIENTVSKVSVTESTTPYVISDSSEESDSSSDRSSSSSDEVIDLQDEQSFSLPEMKHKRQGCQPPQTGPQILELGDSDSEIDLESDGLPKTPQKDPQSAPVLLCPKGPHNDPKGPHNDPRNVSKWDEENISPVIQFPIQGSKSSNKAAQMLGNPLHGKGPRYNEYDLDSDDELEDVRRRFGHEDQIFSRGRPHHFPFMPPNVMFGDPHDFLFHPRHRRRHSPDLSPDLSPVDIQPLSPVMNHRPRDDSASYKDVNFNYEVNIDWLNVTVTLGDLVEERTDAIVCPTTMDLSTSNGIAMVISSMVGPHLAKECQELVSKGAVTQVGQVLHTRAGGQLHANVSFVLHCVVPVWRQNEEESTTHILTCAYLNCLQMANMQLWLHSLSIPLLGTGKTFIHIWV